MPQQASPTPGSVAEVLRVALRLGLGSFGGPIAHLGYFERVYVRELAWLSGEEYASLVALCQILPGPTSSQVGFLIGLHRAGWRGALAAWAGFTLPSALLLYACARLAAHLHGPLAGALVKLTDLEHDANPIEMHLTDEKGRATFSVRELGAWLLNVIWTEVAPASSDVDFQTTFSSLSFGFSGHP